MEEDINKFASKFVSDGPKTSIIKVIGVGGGGGNAVNYMSERNISGVDYVVCNTDAKDLQKSPIKYKIQLGKNGLGAGSTSEVARKATEESIQEIKTMLNGCKMVFVVAGMGGGTGTGATPLIAKTAKDAGILTVAIVTTPYDIEGKHRMETAIKGLDELKPNADALLVIQNEKIDELYPDLPVVEAEDKANELLCTAVKGIAEIITVTGIRSTDFADLERVMKNAGRAIMGTGRASGGNRAAEAANQAINSKLLDCDINGAKGLLINIIQGKKQITNAERKTIVNCVTQKTGDNIDRKIGITEDISYGDDIGVTIIVAGFADEQIPAQNETQHKPTSTNHIIPSPTAIPRRKNNDLDDFIYSESERGTTGFTDNSKDVLTHPKKGGVPKLLRRQHGTETTTHVASSANWNRKCGNDACSDFAIDNSGMVINSRAKYWENHPD